MSALESLIATGNEAPMLDSLDFTLPPASTACVDRRQHVRAYPTSASSLSPTGTRTVRIRLGGDDFIDASSVRIMYTLVNKDGTNPLTPVCGPWGVWSQVFLRSNGVESDNIQYYGRFHQQYGWNQLSQEQQFGEAGVCGMAGSYTSGLNPINLPAMGTVAANGSYTVMHKLHLSLFSSGKLLPTRYMPLELECSVNPTNSDWLNVSAGNSTNYEIANVQLLYDAYILDEAVQESFYKALLANRVLSIPVLTVHQAVHNIAAGTSFSAVAVRAFSRLSSVWLTFRDGSGTAPRSASFICPTTGNAAGATPALTDTCPSVRLSIGPHYWPDPQPAASVPELYYMFQKALPNVPNISRDNFLTNAFTIAFDLRKTPSDPTSAISTRSGDLLRFDLQNLTSGRATEMWVTMFAFSVAAVRESGVTLLT